MSDTRIKAVRVACSGELKKFVNEYQEYNILPEHDVFSKGEVCEYSRLLGMPLLVLKLRPSLLQSRHQPKKHVKGGDKLTYGYQQDGDYFPNKVATILMGNNIDTLASWTDNVGNVLIARQDRKDMHPTHLHMLMSFLGAASSIPGQYELTPAQQAKMFTPDIFKNYYEGVVKGEVEHSGTSELSKVPSPFETAEDVDML